MLTKEELEQLVKEIMEAHEMREDRCETLPLERKRKRKRRRPNTKIITDAVDKILGRSSE